jgi:Lon protease-like protein
MLPRSLPIFPLPNTVLFPNVFLPLHIFEPRYREMVADALDGDRMIGMVLLKPGWQHQYEHHPPVYETGCAGVITHHERLDDGCYNIVLRGVSRFRILGEDHARTYRIAETELVDDPLTASDRHALKDARRRLEALILTSIDATELEFPSSMPDDDLVNALSQYLALEPIERQALLECPGVLARGRALGELLEMKVLTGSRGLNVTGTH